MDIRELRVGDIIYRPDCNDTVVEIRANGIIGLDHNRGIIPFESLEPISLTDELLEKIGFNSNNNGEYINTIGTVCLSIVKLSNCYYLMFIDYNMSNDLLDKPIKYLHQLQHELWDAGIELKIEL